MSIDWEKPVQVRVLHEWLDAKVLGTDSRNSGCLQYILKDGWVEMKIYDCNSNKIRNKPTKQEFWVGIYRNAAGVYHLLTDAGMPYSSEPDTVDGFREKVYQKDVGFFKAVKLHEYDPSAPETPDLIPDDVKPESGIPDKARSTSLVS